jgi:hypothetical protein
MISVEPEGRLGNNIFQYTFARLLQERTGLYLDYEVNSKFFQLKKVEGLKVESSESLFVTDFFDDGKDKILSIDELTNNAKDKRVRVKGFFQHRTYYEGNRGKIQSWLGKIPSTNQSACCVHIRKTDYNALGWSLPDSYYDKCIDMANPTTLFVMSDNFGDSYVSSLISRGAIPVNLSPDESIYFMGTCGKQIISRSTFSWWSSFLSSPDKVFYPRPQRGWWSMIDTPMKDISVDSPEYVYVEVP